MNNTENQQGQGQEKPKTIVHELFEFLVKFEGQPQPIHPSTQPGEADIWNELHVPAFRNFKVFMHQSDKFLLIAIPTHVSDRQDVFYHVIREAMDDDHHNGNYELLSQDEFRAKYKCNFIQRIENGSVQSMKIADLAEAFVDVLPEIKKLKRKTMADRKESVEFFGRMILNFLLGRPQF